MLWGFNSLEARVLLLLLACAGGAAEEAPLGGDRPAQLLLPDGVQDAPLVLVLADLGEQAQGLDDWLGLSEQAEAMGVALLLADGTLNGQGDRFWAATDTCCDFQSSGVDDVGYLLQLIEQAQEQASIAPAQIAALGHGNGGFMAHRLACERDSPVSALLSLGGSSWNDPERCLANQPVRVLQVHGDQDEEQPITGNERGPAAGLVVGQWAERSGCVDWTLTERDRRDYLALEGLETQRNQADCPVEGATELWVMEGAGHSPELNEDFVRDALEFLVIDE